MSSSISAQTVQKWVHQYVDLRWTVPQIALAWHNDYGRTTIYNHLNKNGVATQRRLRMVDISQFISDYNGDFTCKEIAERHGFKSASQAIDWAVKLRKQGYYLRYHEKGFYKGNKLHLPTKGK